MIVSDPDHEQYGKHLSAEEVDELIKPAKETSSLVEEWLRENGISEMSYSPARDWITVDVPVEFAERLLDTEYHNYKHEDGTVLPRATSWSLPRHLHGHIDMIQPTTAFTRKTANAATFVDLPEEVPATYKTPVNSEIAKVCNVSSVTPECFATLYKTKGYRTKAANKNSVAFNNFLGEVVTLPDAEKFLAKYRPEAVSSAKTLKQISINGGPIQTGPLSANQSAEGTGKEANLDFQAIAGISWKTPIVSYSTGGSPPFIPDLETPTNNNEPYLEWVNWVLAQRHIPPIVSTSYSESEQSIPRSYAERVCAQFAAVGARGTTLFVSSGDRGVGRDDTCVSNDGLNTTKYLPHFPPSCPFVTAVGATMNFEPEVSAYRPASANRSFYASGAGFSNYFAQPAWQRGVVPAYVELHTGAKANVSAALFNASGRAYPDLAAQGLYFAYVWNGTEGTISGTSASTPLTAGIFALVNDALLARGKSTLGFLNPWLYKKGWKALNDITSGDSYGCNTKGFPVAEGWDPVTGFGTPDFRKLLDVAL